MSQESPTVIQVSDDPARERRRRRYELLAAAILLLSVIIGTWLQLTYYGVDSWVFIALLNLNGLFMLIILLLVVRNTIKLIMERRRKVFGARMRTRLVAVFVSLSLFPAVVMFLASNRVVATTVDYWFTRQAESSLEAALDVGRSFYTASAGRLRGHSETIIAEIADRKLTWGGKQMNDLLQKKRHEYSMTALGLVTPDGRPSSWHVNEDFSTIWTEVRSRINWDHVASNQFGSLLWATDKADYVIGVLAVDGGKSGFLLSSENIGQGLMSKLEGISKGFEEYSYLKQFKNPLKLSFLLILGILGMVTIFGSIWMAFRLSKQITEPILALAEGTNRVARGDLDFRLEDSGKDELGLLVQSFNGMAKDLQQSRERLTQVNEMLAKRNATVAERNLYIEAVLDSVATGVITMDAEGRILTVNKAACSIFNIHPDAIEGLSPLRLLPSMHAEDFSAMIKALRAKPDEHWFRQTDVTIGSRTWKLVINAVALQGPNGIRAFLAVIEDITELEKMQRMAAWREVARRIAHEIKNPLTPIKLSAERLERRFGQSIDDPVFVQCTELIVRQVERMQAMVQEFSSFAKLPEITLIPNDIAPLLKEVLALFRTSHGRYRWELHSEAPLPLIAMDSEALHRVLMNLFTNAADALAVKNESAPKGWQGLIRVHVRYDKAAETLTVTVEDNGPGLPEDEHKQIFEPYYSNKPGGTGLGLAIVRSIIAEHRGSVTASASPDGGMAFILTFPSIARPIPCTLPTRAYSLHTVDDPLVFSYKNKI